MTHTDKFFATALSARNLHMFQAMGLHLAYDIEQVKIFRINPLAEAIIHHLHQSPGSTAQQVIEVLCSSYSRKDIAAVFQALLKAGLVGPLERLTTHQPRHRPDSNRPAGPGGLTKLVLGMTSSCNLNCAYCLSTLEPGEHSRGMTLETGRKAIDLLLRRMVHQRSANIVFYGGEPLLQFDTIKEIFNYARQQALLNAKTFTYTVITNGTLLTPEMMDFLSANGFTIGLSLDGGRDNHDANRVFPNGSGTFDRVIRNYRQLLDRGADVTPQAVLSQNQPDILEVIRGFQREGVVNYKLIPRMRPDGDADEMAPGQFERMVMTLLDESGDRPGALPIDMYQMMSSIDIARKSRYSCSACSGQLAVSADGGVYPCDNFLYTPGYRLGHVNEAAANDDNDGMGREEGVKFSAVGVEHIPQCRTCWARYLCGGPCPYYSQRKHGRIDVPVESFCRHKRQTVETTLAAYVRCKSKNKDFLKQWVNQRFRHSASRVKE